MTNRVIKAMPSVMAAKSRSPMVGQLRPSRLAKRTICDLHINFEIAHLPVSTFIDLLEGHWTRYD